MHSYIDIVMSRLNYGLELLTECAYLIDSLIALEEGLVVPSIFTEEA